MKFFTLLSISAAMLTNSGIIANASSSDETSLNSPQTVSSESNNAFAVDLYYQLSQEQGNIFFSPISLSTALSMTHAGARGKTAEQMAQILHLAGEQVNNDRRDAGLVSSLQKTREKNGYELRMVNALWGQADYLFLQDYIHHIHSFYGENDQSTLNLYLPSLRNRAAS